MTKFCQMIKVAREAKRLTMTHMACELGISVVYYREVENGEKQPFPPAGKVDYAKLAKVLGLKKGELVKASGRGPDDGLAELRDIILRARELLEENLPKSEKAAFAARSERGPEALVALAEIYTGRPARKPA